MSITTSSLDELTLTISQEIRVNAPLNATFDAILEEMGAHNETGAAHRCR